MSQPTIVIEIKPDGTVTHSTTGFKGTSCTQATKALEEALGGEVEDRTLKPEYYETKQTQAQTQQVNL